MALPFNEFRKRFGIVLLFASEASIVPGDLFDKKKLGFSKVGHIKDYLKGPKERFTHRLEDANMVYGAIEDSMDLTGKSKLSWLGLVFGGGLKKAKAVEFAITGVKARIFDPDKADSALKLFNELIQLRTEKQVWKQLDNCWMAHHAWYATDFATAGGVDLRAEIGDRIDAGGDFSWTGKSKLKITNNDKVPFGISAWEI